MITPEITKLEYPTLKNENEKIERRKNSFLYDYEKQEFIKQGNKFVKSSNIDSIRDWLQRNTLTLIDTWKVLTEYESGFGTIFYDLIGDSFDEEYTITLIKNECKSRFILHPEIVDIVKIDVNVENTSVRVKYTALLLDDTSMEGEVYFE